MANLTITVSMDNKCQECGKAGATDSGICLRCLTKVMGEKPMKSGAGRAAQRLFRENLAKLR